MKIEVRSKSDPEEYRTISISSDGSKVSCDCDGFNGTICSHIDAVLIAQETAMINPEHRNTAAKAIKAISGRLTLPEDWKASWRKNMRWRGLSSRGPIFRRNRDENKPIVCFTGTLHRQRAELIEEAMRLGWETIDSPSPNTALLVAADPTGTSKKIKAARANGTPIITGEEWVSLLEDGVIPSAL